MLAIALAIPLVTGAVLWRHGWVYRASVTLQTPHVTLSDFKRYTIALADRDAFLGFARSRNLLTEEEIRRTEKAMPREGGAARWVAAAFAIRKGDVRDIPDSARQDSQFFGADVEFEDRDQQYAVHVARAVGEFVADAIVAGRVNDLVTKGFAEAMAALGRVELEHLEKQFQLVQLQAKLGELRDIERRYPEAGKKSGLQVVFVDNLGAKYLPPVVQIVGVESLLADTRDMLRDLDHKRERYEADRVLFTATNANLERAATGTDRVAGFERAIASTFSVAPPANSGARESLAQANARVAEVRVMRDQGLRFVSEPVVAAPSLRRVAAVMAVAILGGIVVAGLATLLVAWWGTVRERMRGAGERVVS
jgi:hypothetical protein